MSTEYRASTGIGRAGRLAMTVMLGLAIGGCGDDTPSGPITAPSVSLDFEGSSLGAWTLVGSDTIEFALRQDTNATTRYWFSFQVDDAAGRNLVFRTPAPDNMYGAGGWGGKQPVASVDGGATWSRIVQAEVVGGSFVFHYRPTTNSDRIALTLPYDFSRWLAYRMSIENDPNVQANEVIGMSINGNPIHMLEITDPTVAPEGKGLVWAVARQHPGEPEGSFMIEGFLDWLLGASPEAQALRAKARVLVVPFLNPDGVLAGNQRVNQAGLDMNRQWANPTPSTAPTVLATQARIFAAESDGTGVHIVLDFHGAPTSSSNFFFYNDATSTPDSLFTQMENLLEAARTINPDFLPTTPSQARGLGSSERTRSWAFSALGAHGLTIEGSGTDTSYGPFAGQQMTEARYLALGAAVGEAVSNVLFP